MKIFHPHQALRGAARENSFIVTDEAGSETGHGWLITWNAKEILPARPLRVCFEMECVPAARDILFGALMSRARFLCKQHPGVKARIYTVCKPDDEGMLAYFQQNGMDVNDGNDLFVASVRATANPSYPPTGTKIEPVLLRNNQEYAGLLGRVNRRSTEQHDDMWLAEATQLPYFISLGLFLANHEMVAEILLSGSNGEAVLEMIYTRPDWQRRGAASALFAAAKEELRRRGATHIRAVSMRSNRPMVRLLQRNAFEWQHMLQKLPGIDIL